MGRECDQIFYLGMVYNHLKTDSAARREVIVGTRRRSIKYNFEEEITVVGHSNNYPSNVII